MPSVCLIGDTVKGTCRGPGHEPREFTGTWTVSSSSMKIEEKQVIRVGDHGITDCGHHITAVVGSPTFSMDNQAVHRVGDAISVDEGGEGVSVTGTDKFTSD